jgi:hypothetical protein
VTGVLAAALAAIRQPAAAPTVSQISSDRGDAGDDATDRVESKFGTASAAARKRERGRVKAILNHPAATRNRDLARQLALYTNLPRAAAIAALETASTNRPALGERMQGMALNVALDAPAPADARSHDTLVARILAARDMTRGR